MTDVMPNTLVRRIRDRQMLLWVCQRYDLLPDAEPHDYDLPPTEAALIYRSQVNAADRAIAARYWEAVWLGEPRAHRYCHAPDGEEASHRAPCQLSSCWQDRRILRHRSPLKNFFPSVPPGLLDSQAVPDTHGGVRKRIRERVAQELATRLSKYPGRLVIVLGAHDENDLQRFLYYTGRLSIIDLDVLIVWPSDAALPSRKCGSPSSHLAKHLGTAHRRPD
jgi:hypothetical protein